MYLVAIAWIYVVVMMAVAEAMASNGTVLGAIVTLLLYGVLPLSVVMYLLATPMRRRARRAAEAAVSTSATLEPDGRGHPTGETVPAERKET